MDNNRNLEAVKTWEEFLQKKKTDFFYLKREEDIAYRKADEQELEDYLKKEQNSILKRARDEDWDDSYLELSLEGNEAWAEEQRERLSEGYENPEVSLEELWNIYFEEHEEEWREDYENL